MDNKEFQFQNEVIPPAEDFTGRWITRDGSRAFVMGKTAEGNWEGIVVKTTKLNNLGLGVKELEIYEQAYFLEWDRNGNANGQRWDLLERVREEKGL